MIKQILFLIPALLLLVSCGEEKKELQKDPNYNYVEIEECTIPIAKRFERLKDSEGYLYNFFYMFKDFTGHSIIDISSITEDEYMKVRTSITQNKNIRLVSEREEKKFKIIEWKPIDLDIKNLEYILFGIKTKINMDNIKKSDLNYLLNYCEKTWKLNKGDK